jgi:hypothetical protein
MSRVSTDFRHRTAIVALALGALVFLIGWATARRVLPEWRAAPLPARAQAIARFAEILAAVGAEPLEGAPRASLANDKRLVESAYANLRTDGADWLARRGCLPSIAVQRRVTPTPAGNAATMSVFLCGDFLPWQAETIADDWFQVAGQPLNESPVRGLVRRLVASEGTGVEPELGTPTKRMVANTAADLYDLPRPPRAPGVDESAAPPEYLQVMVFPGPGAVALRLPGTVDDAMRGSPVLSWSMLLRAVPGIVLVLGATVLFGILLVRRHVDFVNGLWIGGFALLGSFGLVRDAASSSGSLSPLALGSVWLARGLAVFVLWSAAESWLRSTLPGFTTSLDAVRAGRLGARAGRSFLAGWGLGSGLAGLQLLLFSAAVLLGLDGIHPKEASVPADAFGGDSPFAQAPLVAGVVVLGVAAARRLVPARLAPALAVLLAALLHGAPGLEPWGAGFVASLVTAAALVLTHQAFGLTALLVAAFNALCLPLALFAARQPEWMAGALAVYGLSSLGLLVLGGVALGRPEEGTSERAGVPRFVRRLEEERRLRYEMDLLARMQLGLLPSTLPDVPGWTIAARSILANEVGGDLYEFIRDEKGGLWIAAGDVAGHGFSCAITQAMTKAALVSLVHAETSPSKVLGEIDRVLRTGGSERSFVSLTLVRVDPATGEGCLANAGHPYALVLGGRSMPVRELAAPGLPLGRGPARTYGDLTFRLEAGEAVLLASDGLFEALDEGDRNYGFERPAALLAERPWGTAREVLERVLADWQTFRGARAAGDDTTLVVLRRDDRTN